MFYPEHKYGAMSKTRKKSDGKQVQLTLPLSSLPTAGCRSGSLRVRDAIREALSDALQRSGLERDYVASELSRLVGVTVNVCTLDSWTAESKTDRRLPLEYAGALALILGDIGLLQAALGPSKVIVLGEQEAAVYEIGKLTVEKRRRSKRERALWEKVNGE